MRRPVKFLRYWAPIPQPREAGAESSPTVADDPIPIIQGAPGPDRHPARWIEGVLAISFILLAPWGGPCDRRNRSADPTTSRSLANFGQENESHLGLQGRDYGGGLPDTALDILDDEDGGEEFQCRILLGQSHGFTPRCQGVPSPIDGDSHHDDSGRSTRSPVLRC
jgi:hypothetical protein